MQDYKFKAGDRVKVNAHPSGENWQYNNSPGFINAWQEEMDGAVGGIYKVSDIHSVNGVCFSDIPEDRDFWFPPAALELVKENESMNTEFQIGDTVWCLHYDKGEVISVTVDGYYPIEVKFSNGTYDSYTTDGKLLSDHKCRSLFFSEPKIEGETARPFQPKLIGKHVVIFTKYGQSFSGQVSEESSTGITLDMHRGYFNKSDITSIHELGPEIKL